MPPDAAGYLNHLFFLRGGKDIFGGGFEIAIDIWVDFFYLYGDDAAGSSMEIYWKLGFEISHMVMFVMLWIRDLLYDKTRSNNRQVSLHS